MSMIRVENLTFAYPSSCDNIFENRGYTVVRENTAVRSGVALKNFLMEKRRIYRTDVY